MSWKAVGLFLPWILVLSSIVVSHAYLTGTLPGRYADIGQMRITQPHNRWDRIMGGIIAWLKQGKSPDLQLMGYEYSSDLAQLSVSVWNKGSQSVTVTGVVYDGSSLAQGVTGSTMTLPTNSIIFASAGQWNMDTGGPSSAMIESNSVATFYLGVGPTVVGSQHSFALVAGTQQFAFTLQD